MMPRGTIQSITNYGAPGYGGPCPPEKRGIHQYVITVYALKADKLGLDANYYNASRLSSLLILLAIAYAWILKVGQKLAEQNPRLVKKCKHGAPRNSITKLGFTEIRNAFWSGQLSKIKRVSSFLYCS